MVAVALTTAGCGAPVPPGAIEGFVWRFAGAVGASGDSVGVLSVTPTQGEVPLEGAQVLCQGPSGSSSDTTDSDGYFHIGNLKPGKYTVTISHPGFVGAYATQVWVYSDQTSPVGDLRLGSVRILCIGINDYADDDVNDLTGAAPDADMLFNILSTDNDLVREAWILKDSQATKSDIQLAIENIGAAMGPRDTFVMTYAGHGLRDPIYEVEYLAPHDYNPTDYRATSIADTELSSWIEAYMPNSTGVFVFDSCHSGGMASAATFVPRGMSLSTSFETMARNISGNKRIVITAASKTQLSHEADELHPLPMPGGTWESHGLFAYSFARGMWEAYNSPDTQTYPADTNPRNGLISCREAFDYAENYFEIHWGATYDQTPWMFDSGNIASSTYIFSY